MDILYRGNWIMRLARRALVYAIGLVILLPSKPARAGIAYVAAATSFGVELGESDDAQEENTTGDVSLSVDVSDSAASGATASASANVSFSPFTLAKKPVLRARAEGAKGMSPEGDPTPAGGSALAGWSDQLTYENPSIVDPAVLQSLKLHIVMQVSGTVSDGNFAEASLFISWPPENPQQPPHTMNVTEVYEGPNIVSKDLVALEAPGGALLTDESATFAMQLDVIGGTDQDFNSGVTDFSNTAELKHFLLTGASGNHVPGTENLRIIGEGGVRYPTYTPLALPAEPSADFDNDGDVDGADVLRWQRGLGTTSGAQRQHGDADADGAVTAADLGVWRERLGAPTSVAAIPEPASAAMCLIGLSALTRFARRMRTCCDRSGRESHGL